MLIDPQAPFFRPLWVRILVVAVPLVWAVVEFAAASPGFGLIFGAAGAYLFYQLFLRGHP
ncbi:hypothetical protein ACEYYB_09000 [Paracoccus sp. p4-l81]|uniref:hypothetical protein n=1 Tax=unclassified Paracoccus (in: a-proteobacteria) TaxID=2688777 RepID=UPI0035B9E887